MDYDVAQVKEKFEKVQKLGQSLREKKIRLESELATLQKNYDSELKSLLEKTGTSTFEEAVDVCLRDKEEIDKRLKSLDETLSDYLSSYSGGVSSKDV